MITPLEIQNKFSKKMRDMMKTGVDEFLDRLTENYEAHRENLSGIGYKSLRIR